MPYRPGGHGSYLYEVPVEGYGEYMTEKKGGRDLKSAAFLNLQEHLAVFVLKGSFVLICNDRFVEV